MTGPGGTEGEVLRSRVSEILFRINNNLTSLTAVIADANELGAELFALQTNDPNVNHAAGLLTNRIPQDLGQTANWYTLIVQILEQYRTHP